MQSQESTPVPVQSMHGPSPSAGMPWEGQDGLTQEEKGRGIWRRTRPCYSQGAKESSRDRDQEAAEVPYGIPYERAEGGHQEEKKTDVTAKD